MGGLRVHRLRDLTTAEIGKLVYVSGVVTWTSEVRPDLLQGTFKCLDCGGVIKNVEQQFKYTQVLVQFLYFYFHHYNSLLCGSSFQRKDSEDHRGDFKWFGVCSQSLFDNVIMDAFLMLIFGAWLFISLNTLVIWICISVVEIY